MSRRVLYRGIIAAAFAALCMSIGASSAFAVGFPYEYDQALSLRGTCTESFPDFVKDPSCPYSPPPNGPTGQFAEPRSIAIDAYGNEYVASNAEAGPKGRIDVFDDEGRFITELLDPNGPKSIAVDSKGNLYALEQAGGSELQFVRYTPTVYEPEAGKIQYGNPRVIFAELPGVLGSVTVDISTGRVFVTSAKDFINEYSSAETGNTLLNTIDTADNPKLNWSNWTAIDAQRRRLFASFCKKGFEDCGVLVMSADAPYTPLAEIDGSTVPAGEFRSEKGWLSIAVDEETGHFFVDDLEQTKNIFEFDEDFEYVATTKFNSFQGGNALQIAVSNSKLNPTAKNRHYLFVPLIKSSGEAFAFSPPDEVAPDVENLEATNISEREAELRATIEPGGGEVDYVFEYVSQAEFEASEWENATSAGAGTIPKGSSSTESVIATIDGLAPGVAYRFRVIATNDVLEDGDEEEGTFRTYADAPISGDCANGSLRVGPSAALPDCRAYELVTPADTNGRPPKGVGFVGDRFPTFHVSPLGDAASFVTEGGSIPGTGGTGGFNGDAYRANRGSSGWGTVRTGPSGTDGSIPGPGSFSHDQGYSFWWVTGEGSAIVNGQGTHYVRYPDGHAELVGQGSLGVDPAAEGKFIPEGGSHIIFQTETRDPDVAQKLEPNAPETGIDAVYDRTSDGVTHVVSLLPGDITPVSVKEKAKYLDAAADGSTIAFEIQEKLYVRVDNTVTIEIGENSELAELADISADGDRVFYVEKGDLIALDVKEDEELNFTKTGNAKVVNIAPDGNRAYFVSTTAIGGSGENPNGAVAQGGQQNLYLAEEGPSGEITVRFVATVTLRDAEGEFVSSVGGNIDGLGLWVETQAEEPVRDASRVNGDGSVLLFQSRANLAGYAHDDVPQIYRYDSAGNRLHCISCIPTETPAGAGASLQSYDLSQADRVTPFTVSGIVANLRPDGKRAFFESTEALVSSDTDEVRDVYEWEEQGVGGCTAPGGCVYLISSGHSARDNYLYGVSRSGDDVFFTTEDVLVGSDNETSSIYDARVGGGFPEAPEDVCKGEGCRPSLTPAPSLTPPAQPAAGDDNVQPQRKPRTCPKGKRKVKRHGKVRCVKKKQAKKKQRRGTSAKKGAGR